MRQASLSRLRQFSLAIAVAGLAFAAATSGWAKDQVRVAGLTWPGYGWWYIAKAKNLAPDLDITYQAIEDPFQSFALMSSGQLEIVSSTAEFAPIGASQNMPVRMFAYGNLSHGTDKLIMRPEITSPADLKGKKVAVMVGGLPQIMMGIYLEKNGMPFDSVEYVNVIMDQAAAAMISGTVAGAELWEPFGTQYLEGGAELQGGGEHRRPGMGQECADRRRAFHQCRLGQEQSCRSRSRRSRQCTTPSPGGRRIRRKATRSSPKG